MFAYADLYQSSKNNVNSGVEEAKIVGINPLFNDSIRVGNLSKIKHVVK